MAMFKNSLVRGALIGLIVGIVILALLWSGIFGGNRWFDVLLILASIPPFIYAPLQTLPELLLVAMFLFWWCLVGATVSWTSSKGLRGWVFTALLMAVLIFGHLQSKITIEQGLSSAAEAMTEMFRILFGA